MAPQVPEQRWLGRWTFFCQWPHPSTRAEMTCMPLQKTWQMNLLWPMDTPGTRAEMTWQMNLLLPMAPPQYQSRDDLHVTIQNLADEPTLANGTPITRAEMPCMPLHKTWQMNLLWPMDPPVPEQRCLAYQYTQLGRWTYFGQWTPKGNRAEMPSHCYWHLVVKNGNFTFYWHLVVKNGNFTLLLTSHGQVWDFYTATDI